MSSKKEPLDLRLKRLISEKRVMLFMKGAPSAPQCGFSSKIVKIIEKHVQDYGSFNILEDPEVREGLKKYSKWPTYPQLYVDGKLVGGVDIVQEMDENGELEEALKK